MDNKYQVPILDSIKRINCVNLINFIFFNRNKFSERYLQGYLERRIPGRYEELFRILILTILFEKDHDSTLIIYFGRHLTKLDRNVKKGQRK